MPSTRPQGSVFRRRLPGLGPGGRPRLTAGWYVRIRRAGQEIRRYAGPDRATALALLKTLERRLEREILLGESPQTDATFAEFLPTFLAHAEREWTAQSFKTVSRLAPNRLAPFFGSMRLRDITRVHIEQFLATQTEVSGATRNRLAELAFAELYMAASNGSALSDLNLEAIGRAPREPPEVGWTAD